MLLSRRVTILASGLSALVVTGLARLVSVAPADAAQGVFAVNHSDVQWRRILSAGQYAVLRGQGTETPFTSSLNHETRAGVFSCAGCDQPAFSSATKFDSGTGWPSFWQPLADAIGESDDRFLLMSRTEVHCSRCGGHFGHVFSDGPPPTGLRYCMNGIALRFSPSGASAAGLAD